MRGRLALAVIAAAPALALAPTALGSQRAYMGNYDPPSTIPVFDVAADGTLTPLAVPPVSAGPVGMEGIAISPDAQHLYAGALDGKLYGFSIAPTGALAPVPGSPFVTGEDNYSTVVTPSGDHVYTSSFDDEKIIGFNVGADGSLTPVPGSPYPAVGEPAGLATTPDGRFLYAAHASSNSIRAFSIGPDGSLSELPTSPIPTGQTPFAISIAPSGRHLYSVSLGGTQAAYAYSIAADGSLTQIAGSPYPTGGNNGFGTTITADGRFLITANSTSNDLSRFSIAADGTLTALGGTFLSTPPTAITSNVSGSRVFVQDGNLAQTRIFAVGPTGVLTAIPGSPFPSVLGDFQSIALTPVQPPAAAFTTSSKGRKVSFDASLSSDVDGTIARYDWDFGDGTTLPDAGPEVEHKYTGKLTTATLTLTDTDNCSTTYVSSGQTAYCNGSTAAATEARVPLSVKVSGDKRQDVGKVVSLKVKCPGTTCKAKVTGKLKVAGGGDAEKFKLEADKGKARSGKSKTLKLKLSGKALAAAEDGSKVSAKLLVKANDLAGSTARAKAKRVLEP